MKAIVVGERLPDYQYMALTMLESGGGGVMLGRKKCSSGNVSLYVRQLNRCTLCICHSNYEFT